MEARILSAALIAASCLSLGASHRTQNFIVTAATPQLAQEIGDAAEAFRRDLAIEWLGQELPPWQGPCPIRAEIAPHLGAGGATSFMFERGRPFGWRMTVQGSRERVLDSVLPHEVTHTIFATHFGRPLPRWADEGACTTVEHDSEKRKQHHLLYEFLTTGRGIAFNKMFAMKEYPADIMPLYSQGYSLARFLIAQGGKHKFVAYVGDGMNSNNWTATTQRHYGYSSLSELQITWLDWVRKGCPANPSGPLLAAQSQQEPVTLAAAEATAGSSRDLPRAQTADATLVSLAANQTAAEREADGDGWYARQAGLAAGRPNSFDQPPPRRSQSDDSLRSGSPARPQSLTRPQEIGHPGQIVIDNVSPQPLRAAPVFAPHPYRQAVAPHVDQPLRR